MLWIQKRHKESLDRINLDREWLSDEKKHIDLLMTFLNERDKNPGVNNE